MKNKFAERLKLLRTEKGLSQAQLALNVGCKVTQAAIALWEQGKRIPSIDVAIIFAEYFNVSVGYIIGTENN